MGNITFEQLPQAVSTLIERVEQLAGKVDEVLGKAAGKDTGKRSLLSLEEVAALLGKSASTIYAMTSEKRIPYRKRGNRLYFFEDEIMQWIETGRNIGDRQRGRFQQAARSVAQRQETQAGLFTDGQQTTSLMKTEDLTAAIARYDPLLADAVGKMVGYIKDRWAAPYTLKGTDGSGQCLPPFRPCGRWTAR